MDKEKKLTLTIPEDLHTDFKILAAKKKTTMKDLLIDCIKRAVKEASKK